MFGFKSSARSDAAQATDAAYRDLGIASQQDLSQFVNSIRIRCRTCAQASGLQAEDEEIMLASKPGLGTAVNLTCSNCLSEFFVWFRAGNVVHLEPIYSPSDKRRAFEDSTNILENKTCASATLAPIPLTIQGSPASDTTMSWFQKGEKNLQAQRIDAALSCFNQALAICPTAARVWSEKGRAMSRSGNRGEAVRCYTKSLEINPKDPTVWFNKGTSLQAMGSSQDAIECFDRALTLDTSDPDIWCNKALALHSQGRTKEEVECLDKAIELNPSHVDSWLNKGCTLGEVGAVDAALMCFEKVLAINPMDTDAWYYKAVTLVNMGKARQAIAAFDRFIDVADRDDPRTEQVRELRRALSR